MADYETSPFANPLPGAGPETPPAPSADPFGGPALWAAAPPPPPPSRSHALYELRPLSLGEILDRTFTIYRKRFFLYTGIATVAATVPVLSTLAQFVFALPLAGRVGGAGAAAAGIDTATTHYLLTMGSIILVTSLVGLVAYSFTQAATVSAVSAVYIGDETSIGMAFRSARMHWFRYVLITLWLGFSAMWLPMVFYILIVVVAIVVHSLPLTALFGLLFLASLVYGVIAYIRNSLGVVASAVEDLPVRKSMRRSKFLVAGHKLRVFAILLLTVVLHIVASVIQGICGVFVGLSHGAVKIVLEAVALVMTFCTTAMVVPVAAIALCLFYLDERVRKEGFDVELLMLRGGEAAAPRPEELASPFSSELV